MGKLKVILVLITLAFNYTAFSQALPELGTEVHEGYNHVFINNGGKKAYLSADNFNDIQPAISGDYVVWSREINGEGQIVRYHVPTQKVLQLTYTSTNLKPQVDDLGRVVWEHWKDNGWQIYYFDGLKTTQISAGKTALNPSIENGNIVYAYREKSGDGTWVAQKYEVATGKSVELARGETYKNPKLVGANIVFYQEVFSLDTNSDVFSEVEVETPQSSPTLEPEAIEKPVTVTKEMVAEEIESLTVAIQSDTPESSSSDLSEE